MRRRNGFWDAGTRLAEAGRHYNWVPHMAVIARLDRAIRYPHGWPRAARPAKTAILDGPASRDMKPYTMVVFEQRLESDHA